MELVTALGRLLHDGTLRDEFAAQPLIVLERLGVRVSDRSAFLALTVSDLEFQAGILLGKRFDLIKPFMPRTLGMMGEKARQTFLGYARKCWPSGANPALQDAAEFCRYCAQDKPAIVCQAELNRLNFALGREKFVANVVRVRLRDRNRLALQILTGRGTDQWTETIFYLGF